MFSSSRLTSLRQMATGPAVHQRRDPWSHHFAGGVAHRVRDCHCLCGWESGGESWDSCHHCEQSIGGWRLIFVDSLSQIPSLSIVVGLMLVKKPASDVRARLLAHLKPFRFSGTKRRTIVFGMAVITSPSSSPRSATSPVHFSPAATAANGRQDRIPGALVWKIVRTQSGWSRS